MYLREGETSPESSSEVPASGPYFPKISLHCKVPGDEVVRSGNL